MHMLFVPGEVGTREHCFDRVEPLVKHAANPLLVPEHPWEGQGIYWPTFLYSPEEQLFKVWYETSVGRFGKHDPARPLIDNALVDGLTFLCYAYSRDGLHWDKPALGKIRIQGSAANNIILADSGFFMGCATVILDAADPDPARRYKLLMYDNDGAGHDGVRTAVSPDGIDWTFVGGFPILPSQDTPSLWHDRARGQYVAFLKARLDGRRARMVSTSRDFAHWSTPQVLLAPDAADSPTLHLYGQSAFHHRGADLGFLNRYEMATQQLDLELIAGRGEAGWQRLPGRPTVLSPGDPGAWDGGMVLPGLGEPIACGNEYWYYYYGSRNRHDSNDGHGAMGLATFTAGRIAGQQFEGEGWFVSAPFLCPGGRLTLDAVAREPLAVEVQGAGYGGALAGFARSECHPVQGDNQVHAIAWATQPNLDALRGQWIVLRISGKNSIVYGAGFTS